MVVKDGSYEARMIKHSIAPCDKEIMTITAKFPRIVLAEVNTHRDRARNAASSRAIPFKKMLSAVMTEPFMPLSYGMEQSGMQQGGNIPDRIAEFAAQQWLQAMYSATEHAEVLHNIGKYFVRRHPELAQPGDEAIKIHKSIPNRLLEPWMWTTVVMTATEWKNFFRLRCHPDAEQHFQKIACMIRECIAQSTPTRLEEGQWHLPFIQADEIADATIPDEELLKVSTARCARVSYLTHDGLRDWRKDVEMFDKLVQGSGFGHWSPHEHVASAASTLVRSGPFIGWNQYRKSFANENGDS